MIDFKFLAENEIVWRTYSGLSHPLRQIHTNYLKKLILIYSGKYGEVEGNVPNQRDGRTHEQWCNILKEELRRRNDTI